MTPKEPRAGHLDHHGRGANASQLTPVAGGELASPERTRALNEVGSAIAHQLNGPLTALRLYVGELRRNAAKLDDSAKAHDQMLRMIEAAFQQTERICTMMKAISDCFEEPLYPETAALRGRDVVARWARAGETNGRDCEKGRSIHERLTPREREVLGQISQGLSNKLGAIRLQMGPRTFESHRFRIMRKLGAKNGADLVRIVLGESAVAL